MKKIDIKRNKLNSVNEELIKNKEKEIRYDEKNRYKKK